MSEKSKRPAKPAKAPRKKSTDERKRGYGEAPQDKKPPKFFQHEELPKGKKGRP